MKPMQPRDIALLASCGIFAGIDPRALSASLQRIPSSIRACPEGSVVILAGCKYSSLHVLIEGEAYAELTSDEGKVVRVESFKAVEALGAAFLFTAEQRLPVTVEAKSACRFAVIPREGLLALCMEHKAVLEALLGEVGARVQTLSEKLRASEFVSLREKLADWLVRRAELSGSSAVRMEASRERMAELFGVARPSLSRELGALQKLGILELSGKEIKIRDLAALRRLRNGRASGRR